MTLVFALMTAQCLLGAFDNLWHHELTEKLPSRPGARRELKLHTAREFLYAVIFVSLAWVRWEGAFTYLLLAILAIEIAITLADFIEEDRTRTLPALERVLHTVLAINFGAVLAVWAPELIAWSGRPTGLAPAFYGFWSYLFTVYGAGVFAWGLRDLYAVVMLGVPEWQRRPMKRGLHPHPRTVLVTGATGFIGWHAIRALLARGDRAIALARDAAKARALFGPFVEVIGALEEIESSRRIDGVINLAGEPLMGGLWTQKRKAKILASRLAMTECIDALIERLDQKPEVLVNGSAIGFYGDRGDEVLTEGSGTADIFIARLCAEWEAKAEAVERFGTRVCCLRIGLVLARDGGVLPKMSLSMRFGMTGRFGNGAQWVSWIHIADMIGLILHAIDTPTMSGAVNAVAPEPLRHRDFMTKLAQPFGRQVRVAFPAILMRALAGDMATLFLASQRVLPERVLAEGFHFRFADLEAAIADLYEEPRPSVPAVHCNETCTACTVELSHYRDLAHRHGRAFDLRAIGDTPDALKAFGLDDAVRRRRLYLSTGEDTLVSGVDAFLVLWAGLPYYRHLARIVRLPGAYHAVALAYEGVAVPVLWAWNERSGDGKTALPMQKGRQIG